MSFQLPLIRTGTVRAACPHDCPDTCAMLVDVAEGRAVRVRGDAEHPVTQGFLCAKVNRYVERTYHPDRVLYPLRRAGAKGTGKFERASWADAIGEITGRLKALVDEFGPEAVLPYSYAGTMGLVQGASIDRRFFHRLGASLLARTICATAGMEGWRLTYGARLGPSPEEAERARLIVLWGTNTLTSNPHLWPALARAREAGAKIIAIDPIRTRTAARCDEHIPIRPGTDAALALAMMNVILAEGLEDGDWLRNNTVGWERLPEQVEPWTAERAEAETGVPAGTIARIAREYAGARPSFIRLNYGMQRHAGGGTAVRTISILPALVGAWRYPGGGATLSTGGAFHLDEPALTRPDWIPSGTRTINMVRIGEALTRPDAAVGGPPVKALFVYNSNPAAVAPDLRRVRRGLAREDLFTVVLEHFQTDTADYADWVLPATTQLEHWDIHTSYGHYYVTLNRPAIDPVGESLPNSEIFRRLARAYGFQDPEFDDSDVELVRQALASGHPTLRGVTFEGLLETGYARLDLPSPFMPYSGESRPSTRSGKVEIFSSALASIGMDPMPTYIPPLESGDRGSAEYPLTLLSPPEHTFLNSTFANVAALAAAAGPPHLWIHPEDAAPRGIVGGELVRIRNERGEFVAAAEIRDDVMPGVVVSHGVRWGKHSPGGRTVNDTTSHRLTDLGGGAVFYDNGVEVELCAADRDSTSRAEAGTAAEI